MPYGDRLFSSSSSSSSSSPCLICVVICVFIGFAIWAIVHGQQTINDTDDFYTNSTKEKCLVISYTPEDCDCGNRCFGIQFDYLVISEIKCNNITLYERFEPESDCQRDTIYDPAEPTKLINNEYDCYVDNICDEYTFHESDKISNSGKYFMIGGIVGLCLIVLCPCLICAYCLYASDDIKCSDLNCKNCCKYTPVNKEYEMHQRNNNATPKWKSDMYDPKPNPVLENDDWKKYVTNK